MTPSQNRYGFPLRLGDYARGDRGGNKNELVTVVRILVVR